MCFVLPGGNDGLLCAIRTSGYKLGLVSNTEALLTAYDLKVLDLIERFDWLSLRRLMPLARILCRNERSAGK